MIGSVQKGATGNKYVNVILKQGEDQTVMIKVMHPVGSELLMLKGEPVKLCKLSKKGDTTFFNEKYGSYVDKLSKDYLRYLSNFIRKRVDLLGLTIIFDLKNQEK